MRWSLAVIVMFVGLAAAAPVRAQHGHEAAPPAANAAGTAAAEHPAGDGHDDHAGGHAGPKYDLLTTDGMTAVWTIVVFLLLLFILWKAAWGPIQKALVQREKFIADSLASAKREREEAQQLLAHYAKQIEAARGEASAIVEEGRRDAEVVKHRIEQEARSETDKMVERAKREIGIAKDTALKDLYTFGAKLATEAASKIIRKEIKPADHERLIREAMEELGKAN